MTTTTEIANIIATKIPTALRKLAQSPESRDAWVAITDMPPGEWDTVAEYAAEQVAKYVEDES